MAHFDKAEAQMREFTGGRYIFGSGVFEEVGRVAAELGTCVALVYAVFPGYDALVGRLRHALAARHVRILAEIRGAAPNAPQEDLQRITEELAKVSPDAIVCLGGGSTLDAAKAAIVLRTLAGSIDEYFGVGKVTEKLSATGRALAPLVAVQTAASSGAHLTKYANITNIHTGQKKLIVDDAIVPARAVFDYDVTVTMPPGLTADGAFDAMAHVVEVLFGSERKPYHAKMMDIAGEAIRLVVTYVERAVRDPHDREARYALGLATDLGGYAIMLGGTNGAHLTSFSLIDILSHGRACAIMNPYYTMFFAPAVQESLRMVAGVLMDAGLGGSEVTTVGGRELGMAVAKAMMELSKRSGLPTTLSEVEGFSDSHIERALAAAKDPQLRMKLENMPVPLTVEMVDEYMRPILEAACDGDLSRIRNVP